MEGNNTQRFEDVLIGEVWVCSGQSNMQWPVRQATDADLAIATADLGQIRLISVPQVRKNLSGTLKVNGPFALLKMLVIFLLLASFSDGNSTRHFMSQLVSSIMLGAKPLVKLGLTGISYRLTTDSVH